VYFTVLCKQEYRLEDELPWADLLQFLLSDSCGSLVAFRKKAHRITTLSDVGMHGIYVYL